jgi:hypothetical protein
MQCGILPFTLFTIGVFGSGFMKAKFKRELIGREGMVLLDTIRRLNRRNAVDRLIKLLNKTHPADIAWVFRHLTPDERSHVFNIIAQTSTVGEFLSELDQAIMLELVRNPPRSSWRLSSRRWPRMMRLISLRPCREM